MDCDKIDHCFRYHKLDLLISLEKELSKEIFEKELKKYILSHLVFFSNNIRNYRQQYFKFNIDMLDYILSKYNIFDCESSLSLLLMYNFSNAIIDRCIAHDLINNITKKVQYILIILKRDVCIMPLTDFNKDDYFAILSAINFCKQYYYVSLDTLDSSNDIVKTILKVDTFHKWYSPQSPRQMYQYYGFGRLKQSLTNYHGYKRKEPKESILNKIDHQTPEICLNALKQNRKDIRFVKPEIRKEILLEFALMHFKNLRLLTWSEKEEIEYEYFMRDSN